MNTPHSILFKASIIDIVALGIAPRDRQGRDATRFAKHVLRGPRSESIHLEVLTAFERCERRLFDNEALETWRMQKARNIIERTLNFSGYEVW